MTRKELEERLIDFSVQTIEISSKIKKTKPGVILENQILRSSTSSALNYGEAIGAESERDFVHKIQVVLKELRETFIALRIIKKSGLCNDSISLENGLDENNQLISIFVKSVNSTKRR
jgi:four helix bundle protein